jgi:Asp-tRNA(Asn)/Glu-tRNA(Gln) amidotransferase A subunit family amidase
MQLAQTKVLLKRIAKNALLCRPVTIKDTIDTAGLRTTSGSKIRVNYVPETDAPAVARLKSGRRDRSRKDQRRRDGDGLQRR